jgi:hypothetical protein
MFGECAAAARTNYLKTKGWKMGSGSVSILNIFDL